jgi:ferredoxin-like protein FixX
MAIWFYRGLRRGIATTRYPRTVDAWTQDLTTPPAFHSKRLTAALADRIAQACPARAIRRDERELVIDLGHCTSCGRCVEVGGDAVTPSGEFLLATRDRTKLRKRVPIRGDERTRDGRS